MFKISAALSLSAIFLAGASATPVRRDSCNPNPQGNPVSVQNAATGVGWSVADNVDVTVVSIANSTTGPQWLIPQTGQSPTSYFFEFTGNSQVITIDAGMFTLSPANPTIIQPNQVFTITCDSCGTDVSPGNVLGEGCVISEVSVETCISIGPDVPQEDLGPLRNLGCDTSAPTPEEVYTIMT